jgi:Integrase core domain
LKKWLRAQTQQPQTVAELQAICDNFVAYYNSYRPHRSLDRRTPAAAYQARPKATPPGGAEAEPQPRVRRDIIDSNGKLTLSHNGRLHHIGIGRTHARTPVLMLINGLDIRIIHATTGEILRELHLNPAVDYQALGIRKPSPIRVSRCFLCLATSHCAPRGNRTPNPLSKCQALLHVDCC